MRKMISLRNVISLLKINKLCVQLIKLLYILQWKFYIILRIVGTQTNCLG